MQYFRMERPAAQSIRTMQLDYDAVFQFGAPADGSLQIPIKTNDGKIIETSYFVGYHKKKNERK